MVEQNLIRELGVVNAVTANGLATDLTLSSGQLKVVGGTATNKGWGNGIDYDKITKITTHAYAAGVYRVRRINFGSAGLSLGGASTLTEYKFTFQEVRANRGSYQDPVYKTTLSYNAYAIMTAAQLAQIFHDKVQALGPASKLSSTYTAGNGFLDIEGQFNGVDNNQNIECFDFTITSNQAATEAVQVINGITIAANAEFTTTAVHGLAIGDIVYIAPGSITWTVDPTGGDTTVNGYLVDNVGSTTTFKCGFVSTGATYGSGGTVVDKFIWSETLFVYPYGTDAIVAKYAPNDVVSGNQYTTYEVDHWYVDKAADGRIGQKDGKSYVFFKSSLTAFSTGWGEMVNGSHAIMTMTTACTKAALGIMTVPRHGLTTGDIIIVQGMRWNSVVDSTEAVAFNGQSLTVTVVNDDTFTVGINTSGYTGTNDANTGYIIKKVNPYLTRP